MRLDEVLWGMCEDREEEIATNEPWGTWDFRDMEEKKK